MIAVLQFLAVLCCMLFAGAAIYINLVEHPARMGCDTKTAATVWAPSYKKATLMQASLAIVSFLTGVGAWLLGSGILWLVGAVLIGLVVPFTFIAVMPTNHQLLAPGRDLSSAETRSLLERWGSLHAARSVLSFLASIVYLVSLIGF
jgi:Anthrone oxygenase